MSSLSVIPFGGTSRRASSITFIKSHNLKGKTVIPFATSGGSTLAGSAAALKKAYPALNWKEGRLLNRTDEKTIRAWLDKLGY